MLFFRFLSLYLQRHLSLCFTKFSMFFPLQRVKLKSWTGWRGSSRATRPSRRRLVFLWSLAHLYPSACLSSFPPCCPCWKPLSRRPSTLAMTAPCQTHPPASWPRSTDWEVSRSFLLSSGPKHSQVGVPWLYSVCHLDPGVVCLIDWSFCSSPQDSGTCTWMIRWLCCSTPGSSSCLSVWAGGLTSSVTGTCFALRQTWS